MTGVDRPEEFIDPDLLTTVPVQLAALDGENADPANGIRLESDLVAHSIWGEMAYRLAGRQGFERVQRSDELHNAPGTDTIIELFGGEPTLILIDEIAIYLRKVARVFPEATNQFSAFIQSLLKAVSATPRVALVFTLAVRPDTKEATDAYREEQQIAMAAFEEAESVIGRKATQLNPTEEDETVHVLKRRLFEHVDAAGAEAVVGECRKVWQQHEDSLHEDAGRNETLDQFRKGYPLHPETLNTLVEKTSSLSTFQRTRGMLRLLARTVHHLWRHRPGDTFAIHPHHIDPSNQAIRDEITTRLGQGSYTAALAADVAAVEGMPPAVAQQIDDEEHPGQLPVASYIARTIFLHTLAYGDAAKGINSDQLRYSVCSPALLPAFVESARQKFVTESLYLDDRPGASLRFMTEPNLTQMIRKATNEVDPGDARTELQERVRDLFSGRGQPFEPVFFPGEPYEVPDEVGDGRPFLVLLGYDAFSVASEPTSLPSDIVAMATLKGHQREYRTFQNNLIFLVADERLRENMKQVARRRLGLQRLQHPDRIRELADHQQEQVKREFRQSELDVTLAILHCYRHLFYPSHMPLGGSDAQLAHTAIDLPSLSDEPGNGQRFVRRALRDQKKVLDAGDAPDAPAFVRDQTPLKTRGQVTTLDLRNEFRRSPKLSILLCDDPLIECIRSGIEHEVFIYREDSQVWGKGDPYPVIKVSDSAYVHTVGNAKEQGLWPRQPAEPQPSAEPETNVGGGAGAGTTLLGGGGSGEPSVGNPPVSQTSSPKAQVTGEGPLRQALTELFENARAAQIERFAELGIHLYEPTHAWKVHQAIATYKGAEVGCEFVVDLDAEGVDQFELRFRGSIQKSNSIKSFLDPQLRSADEYNFQAVYRLAFADPLDTKPATGEAFIQAMTKYGGGEAYVEAHAAPEQEV